MKLRFTSSLPQDATVKEESGLPFGCSLQPYAPLPKGQGPVPLDIADIARCEQCFGYINPYVLFDRRRWRCCFCQHYNAIQTRYATPMLRRELPELCASSVEILLQGDEAEQWQQEQPVHWLLVDTTSDGEFLEMVKGGLLAAIDSMPDTAFVGLITFSNVLGIYDLRSAFPHVREVPIPKDDVIGIEMGEVLGLSSIVVELGENRSAVQDAIDSLEVNQHSEAPDQRGFGSALHAVVQFFLEEPALSSARVTCFIAGLPNLGVGVLDTACCAGDSELEAQSTFYSDLGARAAEGGLAIDILAGCAAFCALPTMRGAVECTGGVLALYEDLQSAQIAEDIFNLLTREAVYGGLLRLRTSEAIQVAHAYGNWAPDKQYDNLYHLNVTDELRTFAFDFEFSNSAQFKYAQEQKAVVQVAFAFSRLHDGKLKRFQRICTVQQRVTRSLRDICDSADVPVVMTLLVHKVVVASLEEGISEAQMLLQDWLVILTAQFESFTRGKSQPTVETLNKLQIPRFVYAMLVSPLLSPKLNPDKRVAAQWLFRSVAPEQLSRLIYPRLSAFSSVSQLDHEQLFLSRKALLYGHQHDDRVYVLDAVLTIMVMCSTGANKPDLPEIEMPPRNDCELKQFVVGLRKDRLLAPHTTWFFSDKVEAAQSFESLLIEEKDTSGIGFEEFEQFIKEEVATYAEE